jgi:hypothetical protein
MLPTIQATESGIQAVTVYRLIYTDISEGVAATRVADLCRGRLSPSSTGQYVLRNSEHAAQLFHK